MIIITRSALARALLAQYAPGCAIVLAALLAAWWLR